MALRRLLFLLAGLAQICDSQLPSPRGKKFVMAFMQDHQKYQSNPPDIKYQLLITGHHHSTVTKVSVSKHMFWRTFVINKGNTATVKIPKTFEMSGSNYFDMTVFIEANKDISVFAQHEGGSSVGTTLVLPFHQLGRVYHVVTPNVSNTDGFKEFAIVAQETATEVDISLKGDVLFNGQAYPAGSKLSVNLEAFQALQLQSSDDLSGTKIESKEPVAVFSGHSCIMKDNACNQVYEQLLPSSSWGAFFIVPMLPFQNRDGILYITASQNTYLKYQHGDVLSSQTLESGEVMQLNKYSSEPVSISASARIQVLYFSTGGESQGHGPLLLNIPAVTSFCKSYDLLSMKQLDNYAIIVAKTSDPSRIRIQRKTLAKSQWKSVPDTEYYWTEYSLARGGGILSSEGLRVPLGVFILGFSQNDGYGSQDHCITSMTCPANSHYEVCTDTCSNHCANTTDAEPCPETCTEGCQCDDGFLLDGIDCIPKEKCGCFSNGHYYQRNEMVLLNACKQQCTCIPGEGLTCTDHSCATEETCESQEGVMRCVQKGTCHVTSRGKSFVTAFMQNYNPGQSGQKLELYISGYNFATNIKVSTGNTILYKTINEGEVIYIPLPQSLEMVGSDKFKKAVLIEADQDISVISYNYLPITSDGTITYPIHQLGQLYYVVTPTGNGAKEFAIIAHEDLTTVTIHLKGTVRYKSKVYRPGSTLVTELTAFEAIQLQSSEDLSGTRIESTKPVAVLSGHTCVVKFTSCDHVVEQLLPVQSWGTTFIAPPLPFQTQYDIAYIVSAENTLLKYQSGSKTESRTLVAGEVVQLEILTSQPLFISADAGIQVLFFFTGAKRGDNFYDPFLMNIPATTCYCNSYRIYGMKDFTNHAMIIAKTSESGRIKWGEQTIQWTKIPGTEYSWAEQDVAITDRAQLVEHENSQFGLFVFGGGKSDGYGTPALCSSVPSCPVNSHYRVCANLCPTTCAKINDPDPCSETCVTGCQCDAGFFFDGLSCVSVESCGCSQDGHNYKPHETVLLNTCQKKCTCVPDQGLLCETYSCATDETCSLQEGVQSCVKVPSCPVNSHYRVCANLCPTTCAKINDPDPCSETCVTGCQCDAGFFFDGLSCVSVESCGCSQDGHNYKPHEIVLLNKCQKKCTCVPGQGLLCEAHSCAADETCSLQEGVQACVKDTCNVSSRGKKFLTAFIFNYFNYQSKKLELYVSGYHPATNITVSTNTGIIHRTINEGELTSIELPLSLEMEGSDIYNKAVLIEADQDISVSSYSDVSASIGGTLIYPIDQLGQLYYVITPTEDSSLNLKEFAVVAHEDPTSVTIHLKGTVTFKNEVYHAGSTLVTDLKAFEAIQLQSTEDLSGSRIESTKPVAVLSGHICAVKFTACDHVVEQLLPVQSWGTTFIVPPIPFQTRHDIAYIVSAENTVLKYQSSSKQESRTLVAGEVVKLEVLTSQPLFISADAGIQVHLFFTGSSSRGYSYDSFLMNIPAITCYCNSYHIYGKKGFINHAMIIAKSSEIRGITMEGRMIEWRQILGTKYSWAEEDVEITDRALSVEHKKAPFGLFVFGGGNSDGYGTAALCSSVVPSCPVNSHYRVCANLCPTTCAKINDPDPCSETCVTGCQCDAGFFFDGLSCVSVESCGCSQDGHNYEPHEIVLLNTCQKKCACVPGQGLLCEAHSCAADETCRLQEGVQSCVKGKCNISSRGKKFVTAFMQNYLTDRTDKKLELYFSGYHLATNIVVTTNSGKIYRNINEGEIISIELPLSLEMAGSDIYNKAVLVEADQDILVSSSNYISYTSGGTFIYPTDQLGQLYYVVTPTEESSYKLKEFAVVAHENLTSVTIHLKGTVTFKNVVYPAGSIFRTDLKAFEAIQLQSTEDLSGSRIESTKPVAVLSGHICATKFAGVDYVVEQLLPVPCWGSTFIVPALPFQTQYDIAYIVSAENTLLKYQSSSKEESRTLVAGEVLKLEVQSSQPLFISAEAGIQVHLFFTGAKRGGYFYDSFLMNIPAITSYCNSYHIYGMKDFTNYAMLIAKSSESSRIAMEGRSIQWTQIPGTEYSWAEEEVAVTDHALSVEHKNTPFGLFVFGGGDYRGYGMAAVCSSNPISCPENSHYEACGNACPATCSDRSAPSTCRNTCAQICQCDEGFVRSGEKCVPVDTCNCVYQGVTYKAGEEFWGDEVCQSYCKCDAKLGKAVCQKSSCKGKTKCSVVNGVRGCHAVSYRTCIGTGDPHYTTFDGKKYDFMGTCVYQMAGLCSKDPSLTPFLVTVENNHRGNKAVSYTKVVTLEIYNFTISLSQEFPQKIQVNGIFVELPFSYENKLSIYQSGVHGFIKTDFDLSVSFDWYSYARVIVPDSYANALCGLCGNANEDQNDDFLMKDGTQAEDEIQFANNWK
ncbi:IgGFc-binding protein-like isoform X2 [Pantherophis guttatus]|uniref:IgGFc-binding protein-like isoform X2 n=1 Tax=Pantherophis guttatus TaxID=94885 RepID=A0ABM3ZNL2_PANGU|nr:IgGFc-binding protein-like isoform X2 [Pantherophis guttatus]